ncbi:exopolysaccharide production repressor protein [Nitratireductor luteus]|uniref:exopolysaccharide production repressor protein n=1 Tax=Nitratireductor luteus TaxID=2976980 RepID=UPI002240DED4|nr:exopolysaccharide production repressor protein [Nitratireductor luteus]
MSFPLFLRGMLLTLTVFAITTYIVTQSWWLTLISTLACAVIIQIGYFATILVMIWGPSRGEQGHDQPAEGEKKQASMENGKALGGTDEVPGVRRTSQL